MSRAFATLVLLFLSISAASAVSAAQESKRPNVLNLTDAISEALKNNPEIQVARRRIDTVRARASQAGYLEDPEIALQAGGIPLSHPTDFTRADTNMIGIRQKIPFFGKLGLKEKIANQEVKVLEEELHAKELEIISRVKMAFADLFMAQKTIEISREQLELMRGVSRATEARYQVGKVTQQDVFKALLEQTEIMNQLVVAEQERKAAEVRLNVAMNRFPQAPIEVPDLSAPNMTLSPSALEESAMANRPELKGAEQDIERTTKMYELAERNRKFPDFMVGWDYWRMPEEMTKNRYAAMVNITIPFSPWTIGRRNYEVEEALAEISAAKANREAIRNMTLREVGESEAKIQAARRSLELYQEGILPQAELSFRASLSAYQNGRVEFVSLLEAQRSLREARMGYFKTLASLVQNLADLERAVGRELQ